MLIPYLELHNCCYSDLTRHYSKKRCLDVLPCNDYKIKNILEIKKLSINPQVRGDEIPKAFLYEIMMLIL